MTIKHWSSADMRHARGFTLVELMVVVAVAAILASLAVSSYRKSVMRAHRTEATAALLNVASAQEKFFLQNNTYADDTVWTSAPPTGLGVAVPDGYTMALTSDDWTRAYTITATATAGQADDTDCATFTLTQSGLRGAKNSGGTDNTQECWR